MVVAGDRAANILGPRSTRLSPKDRVYISSNPNRCETERSKLNAQIPSMRVAFTSDLHIDITAQNRKLLPYLAEEIERLSPDALVLAGDIANTLSDWDVALQAFQPLAIMKFIVPGNHDI